MDERTRNQLRALSLAFYDAHAEAFDISRADLPWPGWQEVIARMPKGRASVLDIGCGNGRFARFLHDTRGGSQPGLELEYTGTDSNSVLLEAARERLGPGAVGCTWLLQDFLATTEAGDDLPAGPFSLVALMGVVHHVPGRDARQALLRAAAARLEPGGLLVITTWQFVGRARFDRRRVDWTDLGPVLGEPIDLAALEPGDQLLRFGDDPNAPPRYCHQVSDEEFEAWPAMLELESVAEFRADGAQGDLNRYAILRRACPEAEAGAGWPSQSTTA